MARKYFPGCKIKARYPEASEWLTEQVACYCVACDIGLEDGGKDAVNLIELVSGKFREE